ncbi:MAG: rRNA maturation RNase YbeY [Sphingomonadales bacterium]|nr:rRNA maturation RNase YbeY [Sphingomonadales bacterium]
MTNNVAIDFNHEAGDWANALPDAVAIAERAIIAVCAEMEDIPTGAEVSVLLTDDAHQQVLNQQWRGKDKPTNVLSFPGDDAQDVPPGMPVLLGDITVAFETLRAEALDQEKSLADHFCHLIVHGMLHLMGFDHETQVDADEMEPLEIEVLDGLGVASPYPDR